MSPVLSLSFVIVAGCLIVYSALFRCGLRRQRLVGYTLGFGPLIGQGLASLEYFYLRIIDGPRTAGPSFLLLGLICASTTALLPRRSAAERLVPPQRLSAVRLTLDILALSGAVYAATALWNAFAQLSSAWPTGSWDAVAIWNLRARFLYQGYDAFPETLRMVWAPSLPHYPLMLPGIIAAQYAMIGAESEFLLQLVGLVNVVAVGVLVFTAVADYGGIAAASAALALLWSALPVWITGFGQLADVLLAYAALGAFVALVPRLTRDRARAEIPAVLGGFCLGVMSWTKNEGTVLAMLLIGPLLIWGLRRRDLGWAVVGALPGTIALLLFKSTWVPEGVISQYLTADWASRLLDLRRWHAPAAAVLDRLLPWEPTHTWSYSWVPVVAGVVVGACSSSWRRSVSTRCWGAIMLSAMLFWVSTYAVTPYDQAWLIATALDRLMLQVYAIAIVGVFWSLSSDLYGSPLCDRS